MRKLNRRKWLILIAVFVAVGIFAFLKQNYQSDDEVNAASLANFDKGYIISDYQMSNYQSMTLTEIQSFLDARKNCNNGDLVQGGDGYGYVNAFQDSSGVTYNYYITWGDSIRYYHVENGKFVCMANERFYGQTAAEIIYNAAQAYHINPQALLVLLQKEQSLVTDSFPNNIQYRSATGYGCGDYSACETKYYGLKNQVYRAAELFRVTLDGQSPYYPIGENYIKYGPYCGSGEVVYVKNYATSALYRYTPYTPSAAALAAGYGSVYGDVCSAYGNRNFYLYFYDWFGDPTAELPALSTILLNMATVPDEGTELGFEYNTYVQHYGWLGATSGGKMAGTVGYALPLEGLTLKLNSGIGIEYRTHIQNRGWESELKRDGEISGAPGTGLQIEAVQISLYDASVAYVYDVYYRVHVQDIGWMDWVKNGEVAGTTGRSLRVEAIQVKIVQKPSAKNVVYLAHVQDIGWMDWVKNGETAGTTGEALRLEAIQINVPGYNVYYRAHVQDIGWMDWVKNGETAGTTGEALRLEAIQINVPGYNVYYRAHVQDIGWMDWVKNGETAGTTGEALRLEAIEIMIQR